MRDDLSKSQKRQIRELAALAHERELGRELAKVEAEFGRWRRGEIDPHELTNVIHKFHNGPARELFSLYTGDMIEVVVGSAIARGVVTKDEVSQDVLEVLRRYIDRP